MTKLEQAAKEWEAGLSSTDTIRMMRGSGWDEAFKAGAAWALLEFAKTYGQGPLIETFSELIGIEFGSKARVPK